MSSTEDRELGIMRILDAPRPKAWEAWAQPEQIAQWWGANGFSTTTHSLDLRAGGEWRLTLYGPDGRDYNNRIVFIEVAKLERLVYKHVPEPGTEPITFQTTVTFEDYRGKTRLQMTLLYPSTQARQHAIKKYNAAEGLKQTVARMEAHIAALPS